MKDMVLDVMIEKYDIEEQLKSRDIEFNDELIDKIMLEIKWFFEDDKDRTTNHIVEWMVGEWFENDIDNWFEQIKEGEEVV